MNISITGNLGSGKTSICKELEAMGFPIISVGAIFRDIAKERGISVIELNEQAKTDRSIDDMLDMRSAKLGRELDRVVFDSRMAWHFVPDSFKVFVMTKTDETARRVFSGENRRSESYESEEDALRGLEERAELERQRFRDLYHVDYYDSSNYNLVIDSTKAAPRELAEEILKNFEEYEKEAFGTRLLMCREEMVETAAPIGNEIHSDGRNYYIGSASEELKRAKEENSPFVRLESLRFEENLSREDFPDVRKSGYFLDIHKLAAMKEE